MGCRQLHASDEGVFARGLPGLHARPGLNASPWVHARPAQARQLHLHVFVRQGLRRGGGGAYAPAVHTAPAVQRLPAAPGPVVEPRRDANVPELVPERHEESI